MTHRSTTSPSTTTQDFFEQKYKTDSDPWDFASNAYEQGRYGAILRALHGRRYEWTFEPGCSIGVLTARLASLSDAVLAMDISPTAAEQARERCRGLKNVSVSCGKLPEDIPGGLFDLIVFSEIGYYFEEPQLAELLAKLVERMTNGGTLLAAHWLGDSEDHILSGDQVHAVLGQVGGLKHSHAERHAGFRLDCWTKQVSQP